MELAHASSLDQTARRLLLADRWSDADAADREAKCYAQSKKLVDIFSQ